MENLPKPNKGGRPRKIPNTVGNPLANAVSGYSAQEQDYFREYFAEAMHSERTHANRYYAEAARGYVEILSDRVKEARRSGELYDPLMLAKRLAGYHWILSRRTVLAEIGRLADGATKESYGMLTDAIDHVAERHDRLTAKAAVAYIHRQRMGKTKRRERIAALHHELNSAINLHRQRYPESTWANIRSAVDLTTKQIQHKV